MKNVIIGTAGHIDHGKTTLIKALTGRATDTLKDEIQRGISINLGFTYFDLPSGKRAGIIDVPGHEKFIKNMIAGAYGIDIVMLTISATEGIKPQTIEHVEIISRLNIKEGIIVLTKCDLMEDELLPLIKEEIAEGLKGTFFENKDIVEIDSLSGRGIDNLVTAIDRLTDTVKAKNTNAPTRLNIDRVFTFKGFGTIVTGTLSEGVISVGDELILYPSEIKTRVRSIQVHENDTKSAYAGQRTALNLANVKVEDIHRGHVLAKAGSVIRTNIIDARIDYSKNLDKPLQMWERIRVYLGASEYFARFVPLIEEDENYAQIRFEKDIWVRKDDLFVIRRYSPMEVCGGGTILEPQAKKHRRIDEKMLNALAIYKEGSDYEVVEEFLRGKVDTFKVSHISTGVSKSIEDTTEILRELVEKQTVIKVNEFFFHTEAFEQITENIITIISDYHNKFTLRTGIPKEELRNKIGLKLKLKDFDEVLKVLINDDIIKIIGNNLSIKSFKPQYTVEQQKIKDIIEKRIYDNGFTPPTISEITKDLKGYTDVLESLVNDTLLRIDKDIFIHADYIEKAKEIVRSEIIGNGEITLAVFRDKTNSSRKYGILILDYLDFIKFTKRTEDKRVLC